MRESVSRVLPLNRTLPTRILSEQPANSRDIRTPEEWLGDLERWRDAGASQVDVWTQYSDIKDPDKHLKIMEQLKIVAESL